MVEDVALQEAVGARYAAIAALGRGNFGQRRGQPFAVERLDQEAVHAGGEAGLAVLGEGVGGQRDDRRARVAAFGLGGADAARGLEAVDAGHVHVHQHQVVGRAGVARGLPALERRGAARPPPARWPSRVSSERVSSALISLSSATSTSSGLRAGRGVGARQRAALGAAAAASSAGAAASWALSEAARTGFTR